MSTCWSRKRPSHLLSCTDIIINVGSRCENISTTNWISLNSSSPAEDPIPNHLNKPIPLFWPVTWSFPTISRYDLSMKLVWNVENRHLFTSFRLFRTVFFFLFFFLHRDFKLKVWSDSYVMAPCHCWHYLLNIWIWKMFLHRFAPFASCCWNRWSWWSCSVRLSFRYKVDGDAVASVHQNSDNIFPASGSNHFTAINFSFIQINWT